nr:MAG: hypothetical protein [Microviridae sp.]
MYNRRGVQRSRSRTRRSRRTGPGMHHGRRISRYGVSRGGIRL